MIDEFLRFQPLYQTRVWGGQALATALGRALPAGPPVGGELGDRRTAPRRAPLSPAAPGPDSTLHEALARHPAEIMGPRWPAGAAVSHFGEMARLPRAAQPAGPPARAGRG